MRCVAIGGEGVGMKTRALFVNGARVDEPYAIHRGGPGDARRDNFRESIVPDGKFFVLGPNRDNSLDGPYFRFVAAPNFVGLPILIDFSTSLTATSPHPVVLCPPAHLS